MAELIRVDHKDGDRFEIDIRQHVVSVDQPVGNGGEDTAPTPTELFMGSLAACVAFYSRRFLARHDLPTDGLSVTAEFAMGVRPARVSEVGLQIRVPDGVSDEKRAALLAVASHCTVHNSLEQPPEVTIELAVPAPSSS
jgi:uncharacterized OsmC-like protein